MCSAALGLTYSLDGKKCSTACADNSERCHGFLKKISENGTEDWKIETDDCGDSSGGTDYTKCPVELNFSTDKVIIEIMCLYKKIVTCGISGAFADEEKCTAYDATAVSLKKP